MSATVAVTGAIIMGYTIASLFFFKFWRRTGDKLFLAFGLAFLLFAATPLLTVALAVPREEQSPFYLLRALAFLVIIVAVVVKSRSAGWGGGPSR
jgi:hypothetical protein